MVDNAASVLALAMTIPWTYCNPHVLFMLGVHKNISGHLSIENCMVWFGCGAFPVTVANKGL